MDAQALQIALVVITGLGVLVLVPYVFATCIIAIKAGGQLKTLRENSELAQTQLLRTQDEFKARTRPYLGFEDLRTEGGTTKWTYTLRNFGWGPASKVRVEWGTGETQSSLIRRGTIPEGGSQGPGMTVFPQQTREYQPGFEKFQSQFSTTAKYLIVLITYSSSFGNHWTTHRLQWNAAGGTFTLTATETGDGEPPRVWSSETERQYSRQYADPGSPIPFVAPASVPPPDRQIQSFLE